MLRLPKTKKANGSILVDIFFKMAHFIPHFKISDATHITNLFFNEYVRIHGLPKSIILDKDTRFIGHFWRTNGRSWELN